MFEVRNDQARHLGLVVKPANGDGGLVMRLGLELPRFLRRERAALEFQAQQRRRRQVVLIAGFDRAQISLGRDVQADGIDDLRAEVPDEPGGAGVLVLAVDAMASLPANHTLNRRLSCKLGHQAALVWIGFLTLLPADKAVATAAPEQHISAP